MNDFLNNDKPPIQQQPPQEGRPASGGQFFDPKQQNTGQPQNAKPFDINNYGTLPKGVGTTQINNRKEGMDQFLKRDDKHKSIDMEKLKEQYFGSKQKMSSNTLDLENLDRYIQIQNKKQMQIPFKAKLKDWFDRQFLVTSGSKSLYIWRSRVFEEMAYLYLPRFFFLVGSCYGIYMIGIKQRQNQRIKVTVKSHRQEQIDEQLSHIETVLNRQDNHFVPGKNIEFDKSYTGDQMTYSFEREEAKVQDELFKMYDEMTEEEEEEEDN